MTAKRITRRRLLAYVGGALLTTGSVVALVRIRGYAIAPEREAALVSLSVWHVVLLEHAARRIAAPDRLDDDAIPTPDAVDVVGFIDGFIAGMSEAMRKDLFSLFAYVEHLAPLRAGFASRFTRLSSTEQDAVLASIEASDQSLLRGGFAGLKSLVFMGYYRDPRTWKILGYAGPWLGRLR